MEGQLGCDMHTMCMCMCNETTRAYICIYHYYFVIIIIIITTTILIIITVAVTMLLSRINLYRLATVIAGLIKRTRNSRYVIKRRRGDSSATEP